jgi:protein transport protein SEC24
MCNLGPDGRRRDADDRPELCRGTVEFVATKEFLVCAYLACERLVTSALYWMLTDLLYAGILFILYFQVRDPMPAVYFFLIDVSMNAIQTGATAAACSAIAQAISDLPVISVTLLVCFNFKF